MEAGQSVAVVAIFGLMVAINSDAAIGAAVGSAFFLMSAKQYALAARGGYTVVSAAVGYGAGIGFGGAWTMLVSILSAAGAIVLLETILHQKEPSAFMRWLLELIRGRR